MTPLMAPIDSATASARTDAQKIGMPICISISPTAQEPAMMATSLRSMPRLITIRPMPRPRMPRMEMLRTRFSRLATLEKPGRVRLNRMSSAIVMSSTICSCDGFFRNCASRPPDEPPGSPSKHQSPWRLLLPFFRCPIRYAGRTALRRLIGFVQLSDKQARDLPTSCQLCRFNRRDSADATPVATHRNFETSDSEILSIGTRRSMPGEISHTHFSPKNLCAGGNPRIECRSGPSDFEKETISRAQANRDGVIRSSN